MNALLRLALKGSAIGAVALLTAAAGCSDSDKDDNDGAAGDSTTGGTTNGGSSSNAGDKGTPGGDKGTAGDDGNAGGTSNAGGDATGGVDNGAGGGTDIVFAQGGDANAGGVMSLTLRALDGNVLFEVTDAGPGLSEDALAHGFDPFFRGVQDGQTSSRGALGLGLSLVRRIARAHGGDARIENRSPGPGAVATLSVPCADQALQNSQAFREET